MHYHYRPEFFLGISGWTEFTFPRESFRHGPDEVCLIPAGVPHAEAVEAAPDRPFRNLVAGFYNNTISLHFAHEARPTKPDIEVIEFFDVPNLDVFLTLANTTIATHGMHGPAREAVLKGLLLAFLGMEIEAVVRQPLTGFLRDLRRQFPDAKTGATGDDDGALDRVFELADVARPVIVHQGRHRLG